MSRTKSLKFFSVILSAVFFFGLCIPMAGAVDNSGYLQLTDFADCNTGTDISDDIQAVIDNNPNRVIFFPDGEYIVDSPILTPADPHKSVSLKLSEFAVVKAGENFPEGEAVIQLGGKAPSNDTHTAGSNYSLEGGIIDGSGKANGVSINSGRETAVRNVSIKNTVIGLHIMYGANSGSSDSDITGVNIIGNGTVKSVGVLLEGFDNTLTNIRIGNIYTGVHVKSSGNILRNIHPLYYSDYTDYEDSCGFLIESNNNWFDYCYSDNFAIGYRQTDDGHCTFTNSFCFWYTDRGGVQTVFKADGKFNSDITGLKAGFNGNAVKNILLVGKIGGTGSIENIDADTSECVSKAYRAYEKDFLGITRIFGFFAIIFEFFANLFK
ncbi:MAG: hypothetical protein IKL47_06895 [Clostridia bacterium]|nr:hypothetical protein [Clostridia bacterium]